VTELRSRLLIGAIGSPCVVGTVWAGSWWLFALAALAATIAVQEFVAMAVVRPATTAAYGGTLLALVGALFFARSTSATPATSASVLCAGWIGLGLAHLLLLRNLTDEALLITLTVIATVWVADTCAYLGGRTLGRHKLAPALSPRKTWEGFAFGLACGGAAAFAILRASSQEYLTPWQSAVFGITVAVTATAGDMFESALKRDAGVKDSSRLLGAQGGMLDRLDAFLFASPAAFYLLLAFGHT
jgi:phosphatidate cytidylyltransferase